METKFAYILKWINLESLKNKFFLFKIHHWIKNLIIFLPVIASHELSKINIYEGFFYFFLISIFSSIIYLINNTYDYEVDLVNKKKLSYVINKNKKKLNYILGTIFYLFILSILIFNNNDIWKICLLYFSIAIFYNLQLKKIKYIDIICISIFHMTRIIYGSIAFDIDLTTFFLIFFLCLFLMIAFNKRLNEVYLNYKNRPYKFDDISILKFAQILMGIVIIIFFYFYINSYSSIEFFKNKLYLNFNLILIILIILNYLFLSKNRYQDVIDFILKNKTNQILMFLFFLIYLINSNFF